MSISIAVTGASGLIGTALVSALQTVGHDVRRLVRTPVRDDKHEIYWNPAADEIDAASLQGVDAVVHLAGKNIACRWNERTRGEILDSRVRSTRLLAETLARLQPQPRVLVSASATGFYGDRGDEILTEQSAAGANFLADVCQAWEAATRPAWEAGIRVAQLRTGMVLSTAGGGLAKMLTPFKLGLGGIVGSGRQYMSWIHLDDEIRAIRLVVENDGLSEALNLVAPEPVTNRQFTKTLGRVLRRPTLFPMPAPVARLAFGQMADELLLASARVRPTRLEEAGFEFAYPQLEDALTQLLN